MVICRDAGKFRTTRKCQPIAIAIFPCLCRGKVWTSSEYLSGEAAHTLLGGEKEAITFNCSSQHEETGENMCLVAGQINTHTVY